MSLLSHLLPRLHHPLARDLAWVASSPNLLCQPLEQLVEDGWFCQRIPDLAERLLAWDRQPEPLAASIAAQKSHFLGPYFEQLVLFLLQQVPGVELLGQRLQVRHQGQTLGEFDLLFRDRQQGRLYHWELALKYYLAGSDAAGQTAWWGPNANDRLELKFAKLRDQQLTLAQRQPTWLRQQGIDQLPLAQALVKGMLFYPASPVTPPAYISGAHLRGRWCYQRELAACLSSASHWVRLEKSDWLAPLSAAQIDARRQLAAELSEQLSGHFVQQGSAVMLAALADGQERERLMVVADHWPQRHDKQGERS